MPKPVSADAPSPVYMILHFPIVFLGMRSRDALARLSISRKFESALVLKVQLEAVPYVVHWSQCQPRLRDDAHRQRNGE